MKTMHVVRFILILCCVSSFSYADTMNISTLLQEMTAIKQDEVLFKRTLDEGYERAVLCVHCHGEDGNSKRDRIPNLASQNSQYLFIQFEHFANGIRKDYVMSKLASGLTAQDRLAVALYFSEQTVKPRDQAINVSESGARLYMSNCIACHGKEGHGSAQYPRIAGQPYAFLEMTLLRFMNADEQRQNSPMTSVVKHMSAEQLKEVAAFITNMP